MGRLNQAEPASFSILSLWAFFRDSYFSLFSHYSDHVFVLVHVLVHVLVRVNEKIKMPYNFNP
jgi:hypothetical protein